MGAREQKQQIIDELKAKLGEAKVAIFSDYRGLTVAEATQLRNKLRAVGGEFKVAKNTLTRIAAKEIGLEGLDSYLEGPTAMTLGLDDPVAATKVIYDFAKDHKQINFKIGVLEGKLLDVKALKDLADLPPREILLGKVLGGMQGPLYGFANVMHGMLRNLVYVLEAVRKHQAGEA